MQVEPDRAYTALAKLGHTLNLDAIQAAMGVIEVVNAQMERALRVISVERGHDPRDFSLFSFGGAELARHMGINKVIIPKYASTLSAYGMLASNVIKDYVQTVMLSGTIAQEIINELFSPLINQGLSDIKNEGIPSVDIEVQQSLDIRYKGQSYELNVPYSENFVVDFHNTHYSAYGYSYVDKPFEIVNLRVRAIGRVPSISLPKVISTSQNDHPIPVKYKQVEFPDGSLSLPVFEYGSLIPGTNLSGPAIIVSDDTTILINKNDVINVDQYQNLFLDVHAETLHITNFLSK
jgi:N-methylhydantoinase A